MGESQLAIAPVCSRGCQLRAGCEHRSRRCAFPPQQASALSAGCWLAQALLLLGR
jgi:hypothetical protein